MSVSKRTRTCKNGFARNVGAIALSALMLFFMAPVTPSAFINTLGLGLSSAFADTTVIATGTFPSNSNVLWTLTSDGALAITGSGVVSDDRDTYTNLWGNYQTSVKSVTMAPTVQPTTMAYWFRDCKLVSLDTTGWDTSVCTSMTHMLLNCYYLQSVNLSGSDTSKVTDMSWMFWACFDLTSLDLSDFNTSSVTNMSYMFQSCTALTSIKLPQVDTSKVTSLMGLFYNCTSLGSVDFSKFNTSSVTNMSYMLYICPKLYAVDLSGLDMSKVTDVTRMFTGCSSLASLDFSKINAPLLTNTLAMFGNCASLASLNLSGFDTSKVTNMEYMFYSCSALKQIELGSAWSFKGAGSTVLTTLPDAPSASPYTGKWVSSSGDVYTAADLANNWNPSMSGTYTWGDASHLLGTSTLAGSGVVGSVETASVTGFSSDATPAYQWYLANDETSTGVAISGAITSTYTLGASDLGKYLYVVVTDSSGVYNSAIASSRIRVAAGVLPIGQTTQAGSGASRGAYKATSASAVTYMKSAVTGSVTVPDAVTINGASYKVTAIASNAIAKADVQKVTIGKNVTSIGQGAFASCTKLKTVSVSSASLKSIGASAFSKDKKLTSIIINKTTKLTKNGVKNSLKGSSIKTVHVKSSKVKAYKKFFTKANCGKKVTVKK